MIQPLPIVMLLATLAPATAAPIDGYMDHAALAQRVRALATDPLCSLTVMGTSGQGREIFALTLAGDAEHASEHPALLITAGLDGRHLVGTETAIRVAERLTRDHGALLDEVTVYVVPRMNPDAAETNLGPINGGHIGTFRPSDDDHDGAADEDPAVDLNGDGLITMMRRLHPSLDDKATHMADPVEPRLLKEPDPIKGETAMYAVYTEGLDQDGDGRIAEDGIGGVDLDRNFMHEWPEYAKDAGPYQLSESESAALAAFVLAHPEIVAAITYGRHDTVIKPPDAKGKDVSGEGPKAIDEADLPLYEEVSKLYRETTSQERAAARESDGAFHAWLYAQRSIPSFAVAVWGRPDVEKEAPPEADGEDDPAVGDAEPATSQPVDGGEKKKTKKKKEDPPKPADPEAAAWLEYLDAVHDGAGFVPWAPFDHPTLGAVEIGGFVPGIQMNPPAELLDELAEVQVAFAVALTEWRPRLRWEGPDVERLADNLYRVRFGVVNEGRLPTATAMSRRTRAVLPTIIRLSTPLGRIVSGERVQRVWGIAGSNTRSVMTWIIRLEQSETAAIEIDDPRLGTDRITVPIP